MLEELGARFELVVEAVSGFGGKVDKLKEEIFGQFAEVGSQIRFLSDQIGENRSGLNSLHADFGAEMVRLNETIGRTRVEFREQLATSEANLRGAISSQPSRCRAESRPRSTSDGELGATSPRASRSSAPKSSRPTRRSRTLSRKFERFDDRMTVQVKDQDQRLKKVEGAGRRR